MFPGIISWSFIILPFVLAVYKPSWVAYFILVYSVYWVYTTSKYITFAYIGHKKLLYVCKHDWLKIIQEKFPDEWDKYHYCSIIPFASESINIVRETVKSIADSNFPKERLMLCLSSEKALPQGKEVSEQIKKEFKDKFQHIFITEHELKPGEMKGKSANQNHAGRFLYKEIEKLGLDPAYVLLTSNDADVINHKEYIPHLIFKFLSNGEYRHKRIYQPVPTDYYDHWNANFFSRIIVSLGVQWRLAIHQRDDYRTIVYAFYSMSLKMLKDIDFWDVDLIPEDERTQFNAMFKFARDFKVVQMYIPTQGRAVQGKTVRQAFKEQYKQIRRWAWGASEFAVAMTRSLQHKHVPWTVKLTPMFGQIRNSTEWITASAIPIVNSLVPIFMNEEFKDTYLGFGLPRYTQILMTITTAFIILIIYIEFKLAPKRPSIRERGFFSWIFTFVQWGLLPVIGFILSAIPALEAQTRLILNKRIVYIESKKE